MWLLYRWTILLTFVITVILGIFFKSGYRYFWSSIYHYNSVSLLLILDRINQLSIDFSYANVHLSFFPYYVALFPHSILYENQYDIYHSLIVTVKQIYPVVILSLINIGIAIACVMYF